jgi:elongation factor Ts
MANFTAADVKKLRDLTGAGMMDSKNALTEADGDFEKATEILRIKGAKDIGKRAGRTAAEGLVAQSGATLLELNCETDFVAKSGGFIELAQSLVEVVDAQRPADVDALLALPLEDGRTAAKAIEEEAAKLGEKLVVNRFGSLDGSLAVYMHRKSADLPPAVGVEVAFTGDNHEAARAAAMQIAAMRPKYLTRDEVPAEVVENERRIAEETAREEGKPEQALPKIVEGRVNGFFKDVVLLEQSSVTEQKKSVKQVLDAAGVTITKFIHFEVGQS